MGVGDDAAVIYPSAKPGRDWVLSCDSFLEGVHFLKGTHPPSSVGYKALARATSDLAAMGAQPRFFLMTLALTPWDTGAWLNAFLKGMASASRRFGIHLIGGDTARQAKVGVTITVLGQIATGDSVLRSGASPGDLVFVSGTLGAAQLGLEVILRGLQGRKGISSLLAPHLYPPLRLDLGHWLASRGLASAMIDTSDGLSTDLANLCASSGLGARIRQESIPAVRVPDWLLAHGFQANHMALHGGEDYELLFTVPRQVAAKIPKTFRGVQLTYIGETIRGRRIVMETLTGKTTPLLPLGWDHFRT